MMKVTKAVIPAAGMGTRFLPATKAQPKEMLPIVDTPTIQMVVEEAVASGVRDILIITSRDKRSIEDHFDRSPELERRLERCNRREELRKMRRLSELANIHYIRQTGQKGLGHAILLARCHVADEPFAVLLGDTVIDSVIPCAAQLIRMFDDLGGPVVGLEKVDRSKVERYGIIAGRKVKGRSWLLSDIVEKPRRSTEPSNLAVAGRYVLTPEIFKYLEATRPDKNGEVQLTDALRLQCREMDVYGCVFAGTRHDIGDKLDYVLTQVEFALRRPDMRPRLAAALKKIVRGL